MGAFLFYILKKKKKKNGQVPRFQDFNQDKLAEVQ